MVPFPWGTAVPVVKEYQALAAKAGHTDYNFSAMEGFLVAKVMVEGLRRAGKNLTREGFVDAMEKMQDVDLGGFYVSYSPKNHAGSKFVDLTIIGARRQVPALGRCTMAITTRCIQTALHRPRDGAAAEPSAGCAPRLAMASRPLPLIGRCRRAAAADPRPRCSLVLLLASTRRSSRYDARAGHVRHALHRRGRQDPHALAAPRQGGAAGLAG